MVKELRLQGLNVDLVTTNDNGVATLDVPTNYWVNDEGINVLFFRYTPPISSIREFAFSPSLTQWLWQNIQHYELLHIHAIFSYPSTIAMARSLQFPVNGVWPKANNSETSYS